MAAGFTVVGQREDIEFLGGTQTRAVVAVSAVTKPHGVYFETRILRTSYSATVVKNVAQAWAALIEQMFDIDGVAGQQWSQVPTSSGELRDTITVTVESKSGQSSASLDFPFDHLVPEFVSGPIASLRKQLDDAEAL
jgi:hypothetical protein